MNFFRNFPSILNEETNISSMQIEEKLIEFADKIKAKEEQIKRYETVLDTLQQTLEQSENYSFKKFWKTSELDPNSKAGQKNNFDAISVIYATETSRKIPNKLKNDLKEFDAKNPANKAVKLEHDGISVHIVPTKFAQQGTIMIDEPDYLYFSDVVGYGEIFKRASLLLQHWQVEENLDLEYEALLPYEIEITLAHLFSTNKPKTVQEAIELFFEYAFKQRFVTQLNIFDKHDNVLLYHTYQIPKKQHLLMASERAYNKFNTDNPDLSIFGIN